MPHPGPLPQGEGEKQEDLTKPAAKPAMEFHHHEVHIRLKKPPSSTASITISGRCSIDLPFNWKSIVPTTAFFSGAVSCGSVGIARFQVFS